MTRNERRLLVAIVVGVCLAGLAVLGAPLVVERLEQNALTDLAAKTDTAYSEGDWVTLDSEDDAAAVVTVPMINTSVAYDVGLQFEGSIRFRIDSTCLYDDFDGSPIMPSTTSGVDTSMFDASAVGEEYDLLLVDLTVENIDAATMQKTEAGDPLFLVTTLVSTDPLSECVYVSDYHVGGDAKGSTYFSLCPGEEKSLTIGYAVRRADLDDEAVSLSGGFKNPNKYRVVCNPADFRSEVTA